MDTENKRVLKFHLPQLVKEINPRQLLPYLRCLSTASQEEIEAYQGNYGRSCAVQKLYENLIRKPKAFNQFLEALRNPEVDQEHLADQLDPPVQTEELVPEDSTRYRSRQPERSNSSSSAGESVICGYEVPSAAGKEIHHQSHGVAAITANTLVKDLNAGVFSILRKFDYGGLKKWDDLAGLLGFTMDECNQMMATTPENKTSLVINNWCSKDEATLGKLMEAVLEMERIDVLKDLEEITGFRLPGRENLDGADEACGGEAAQKVKDIVETTKKTSTGKAEASYASGNGLPVNDANGHSNIVDQTSQMKLETVGQTARHNGCHGNDSRYVRMTLGETKIQSFSNDGYVNQGNVSDLDTCKPEILYTRKPDCCNNQDEKTVLHDDELMGVSSVASDQSTTLKNDITLMINNKWLTSSNEQQYNHLRNEQNLYETGFDSPDGNIEQMPDRVPFMRVEMVRQESQQPGRYIPVASASSAQNLSGNKIQDSYAYEVSQAEISRLESVRPETDPPFVGFDQNVHTSTFDVPTVTKRELQSGSQGELDKEHKNYSSDFDSIKKKAGKYFPSANCDNSGEDWENLDGVNTISSLHPRTGSGVSGGSSSFAESPGGSSTSGNQKDVDSSCTIPSGDESFEIKSEDYPSFNSDIQHTRQMQTLKSPNFENDIEHLGEDDLQYFPSQISHIVENRVTPLDNEKMFQTPWMDDSNCNVSRESPDSSTTVSHQFSSHTEMPKQENTNENHIDSSATDRSVSPESFPPVNRNSELTHLDLNNRVRGETVNSINGGELDIENRSQSSVRNSGVFVPLAIVGTAMIASFIYSKMN